VPNKTILLLFQEDTVNSFQKHLMPKRQVPNW